MVETSNRRLLSTRNILGVVLVAGIGAGIYLGDYWKGLGGGSSLGVGIGDGNSSSTSKSGDAGKGSDTNVNTEAPVDSKVIAKTTTVASTDVDRVVTVVIADRSYFIRTADGDVQTELNQVVEYAKGATGDVGGIKVRIYRKPTSRPTPELALRDALNEAGIVEDQTVWIANPID